MKVISVLIFLVSVASAQHSPPFLESKVRSCSSSVWVGGYSANAFFSTDSLPWELKRKMERNFASHLGSQLAKKVLLAVGFKYNLDSLYIHHWDEVKDYQWEIPEYYLNYALCDSISGLVYCMEFMISKEGEVLKGYIPEIKEEYHLTPFISKEQAIYLIGQEGIKTEKLKGFDLRNAEVVFNREKGFFEWSFGLFDKIWVEAMPDGEIRVGKDE